MLRVISDRTDQGTLRPILDAWREGRRDDAIAGYERWLPLINYENRQAGLLALTGMFKGSALPADKVTDAIDQIVEVYLRERHDGERFLDTLRRTGDAPSLTTSAGIATLKFGTFPYGIPLR